MIVKLSGYAGADTTLPQGCAWGMVGHTWVLTSTDVCTSLPRVRTTGEEFLTAPTLGTSIRPEMKEEPSTWLDLFKFFCVGFGKGGHVNFIGVGQDLGHKMPNCLVLAVPLVRRSALAQGTRGCLRIEGGSLSGCHCIREQCCSLSHLGYSERLSACCLQ